MTETSLGMNENVEGALSYLLFWVTGIVFYILEKDNEFVKFHAMQSIVTFLGLTVIGAVLSVIPFIGWILSPLISLLAVVLWLILMLKAYQGEKFKLPIVGDFVENQMSS